MYELSWEKHHHNIGSGYSICSRDLFKNVHLCQKPWGKGKGIGDGDLYHPNWGVWKFDCHWEKTILIKCVSWTKGSRVSSHCFVFKSKFSIYNFLGCRFSSAPCGSIIYCVKVVIFFGLKFVVLFFILIKFLTMRWTF